MPLTMVHNITDRTNTPGKPQAYLIGGQRVGPGKHIQVDAAAINDTLRALHGTRLWFGPLHARFKRTSRSALRAQQARMVEAVGGPLTFQEARTHLGGLQLSDLLLLCDEMTPPLTHRANVSRSALVARLSRAVFQRHRVLNPEQFFWLRRWRKSDGDYIHLAE